MLSIVLRINMLNVLITLFLDFPIHWNYFVAKLAWPRAGKMKMIWHNYESINLRLRSWAKESEIKPPISHLFKRFVAPRNFRRRKILGAFIACTVFTGRLVLGIGRVKLSGLCDKRNQKKLIFYMKMILRKLFSLSI